MSDEDPWDYADDGTGHNIIPGAEDEPDSVFPDPAFDPELWPLSQQELDYDFADTAVVVADLSARIRQLWPAEGPWNATRAAGVLLTTGRIQPPPDLSADALALFAKTHMLMCKSSYEIRELLHDNPDFDELTIWKLLLRGGICERLVSAPGETSSIKIVNAMRGERKVWPSRRRERLWQQVSYPAGLAEATLTLLERLALPQLAGYREELQRLLPKLRRCRKATQERRSAR